MVLLRSKNLLYGAVRVCIYKFLPLLNILLNKSKFKERERERERKKKGESEGAVSTGAQIHRLTHLFPTCTNTLKFQFLFRFSSKIQKFEFKHKF